MTTISIIGSGNMATANRPIAGGNSRSPVLSPSVLTQTVLSGFGIC